MSNGTEQPVARTGDVTATPSLSTACTTLPDATGAWSVKPPGVSETLVESASNGGSLLAAARCTFHFEGSLPNGAPQKVDSLAVELEAARHVLRVGEGISDPVSPLRNGEQKTDSDGNTLEVRSSATWRTA